MNLAYVEAEVNDVKKAAAVLSDKLESLNFKIGDQGIIRIYDSSISTLELSKLFAVNDVEISALGKKTETLEDYFLKLTGEVEK